jgi:hypothetical protein
MCMRIVEALGGRIGESRLRWMANATSHGEALAYTLLFKATARSRETNRPRT